MKFTRTITITKIERTITAVRGSTQPPPGDGHATKPELLQGPAPEGTHTPPNAGEPETGAPK